MLLQQYDLSLTKNLSITTVSEILIHAS